MKATTRPTLAHITNTPKDLHFHDPFIAERKAGNVLRAGHACYAEQSLYVRARVAHSHEHATRTDIKAQNGKTQCELRAFANIGSERRDRPSPNGTSGTLRFSALLPLFQRLAVLATARANCSSVMWAGSVVFMKSVST